MDFQIDTQFMPERFGCPIRFDNSKTVLAGAHGDTLGMMVRSVDPNGMERTHTEGMENTVKLLLAYTLDI